MAFGVGRWVRALALLGVVGTGLGCGAQAGSQRPPGADVRKAALVRGKAPTMLLAGPGWLLHVNHERREHVAVFRVPKREGTVADCQRGRGDSLEEVMEGPGRASLYVRAGEVLCAAAPRTMRLSWHAQPLTEPDINREALARLD
jgi:hypothetical protein